MSPNLSYTSRSVRPTFRRGQRSANRSPSGAKTIEQLASALSLDEIAKLADPVLRNRLITHSYYQLSMQMVPLLDHNLSWVGFSSWVSELAGQSIRGEITPFAQLSAFEVTHAMRACVARGNQLVFAEIAPAFRDFIALFDHASAEQRDHYRRLATEGRYVLINKLLREAMGLDPRPLDAQTEGQALLLAAFEQYFLAIFERDATQRAQRVFIANFAIGLHEQQRLDPIISDMLDVPAVNRGVQAVLKGGLTVLEQLKAHHGQARSTQPYGAALSLWRRLGACTRRVVALARDGRFTHAIGTQQVLALPLRREVVAIGRDIPALPEGGMFPAALRSLEAPAERDERYRAMLDLLLVWDRTPNTTEGSAADDWSKLGDRMNFIVDLFRSRQQDRSLFHHPLGHSCNEQAANACPGYGF